MVISRLDNSKELLALKEAGRVNDTIRQQAIEITRVGVSTLEIDTFINKQILESGMKVSFKGVDGYKFSSCININEGVLHGIPSKNCIVEDGDIVTIDMGVNYKGLHTDTSWTFGVGKISKSTQRFLDIGEETLFMAIDECNVGARIGDIASTIQRNIERNGYNVIREFVGHGVGYELHEDPQIPCAGKANTGLLIKNGMVLAIEVMYTQGSSQIVLTNDGWTYNTKDGKLAGMFEHTIVVTDSGPVVLTSK